MLNNKKTYQPDSVVMSSNNIMSQEFIASSDKHKRKTTRLVSMK